MAIRRAAFDFLARREYAFDELVGKLCQKFCCESGATLNDIIIEQVSQLADENLQSDERFTESFVNGRQAQGKGPLRIRQELESKGVADTLIEHYLCPDDELWFELARQVYHKKYGHTPSGDFQEKSKRMRFMLYRGFSYSQLSAVVD